jgi:hypothetical protein
MCGGTAAVLAAVCLVPAGAAAMPTEGGKAPLSPELAELAKPSVHSKSEAAQARILGVAAEGPGSLVRRGDRVLVNVRFDHGAIASEGAVEASGGDVLDASRAYQTATVAVTPAELSSLAEVPTIASITPVRAPMLYAVNCEGGSVISEGVTQLGVAAARTQFGLDGSGVKVGVLSDSFNRANKAVGGGSSIATKASGDEATADLPGTPECAGETAPVEVVSDPLGASESSDEGRAMLQIVHDIAPKAALSFASAFVSEESFASNIEALAAKGASVIVDDVAWFEEPFFQDGPVAAAVNKVTSQGVTYLSAAGNDNLLDSQGREIASWEAPQFRDSGGCPLLVAVQNVGHSHCMNFDPGSGTDQTFGITVEPKSELTLDLQWAEPWNGVGTDLDAYLLGSEVEILTKSINDNPGQTHRPVEILQWENTSGSARTVQLVINRYSGGSPRLKFALLQNGGGVSATEYPESDGTDVVGPTIYGHAGAAADVAVGAVPYSNSAKVERYSSRGPVTHYFGPVNGSTAAAALPIPEIVSKPDVAATDCGGTTFFATLVSGVWRFCGTSAAAPHAAGIVALMKQRAPLASPTELREALVATASPVGGFGSCAVGGGLVEAIGAVKKIGGEAAGQNKEGCKAATTPPVEEPSEEPGAPDTPMPNPNPTPPPVAPRPALAPATSFGRHPAKRVHVRGRSARLTFSFLSDQAGVTFLCQVDSGAFRACGAKLVRRFRLGGHVVRVAARGSEGATDQSPAVFRFRVLRVG